MSGTADVATTPPARGRRPSLPVVLIVGGLVALAVVLVVARLGGGDPYAQVLEAGAGALDRPVATEVTAEIDLGRLGELAPADGGGGFGLGLLSGRVTLRGHVVFDDDVALLELRGPRSGGVGSIRLDAGEPALARLDADLVGELPGGRLLRTVLPGVLGDGWVTLSGAERLLPAPSTVTAQLDELRAALATADRDAFSDGWEVTRVGRDDDGQQLRVARRPEPGEPAGTEAAHLDVWVDGDRLTRVELDALPFLRAEVAGVALRGGDGGLLLTLRPTEVTVPPRPEPTGLLDAEALRRLLPF